MGQAEETKTRREPIDDGTTVWMALITERDRLERSLLAGKSDRNTAFNLIDIEDLKSHIVRVKQLIDIAYQRKLQIAEAVAGIPKTNEEFAAELVAQMKLSFPEAKL